MKALIDIQIKNLSEIFLMLYICIFGIMLCTYYFYNLVLMTWFFPLMELKCLVSIKGCCCFHLPDMIPLWVAYQLLCGFFNVI